MGSADDLRRALTKCQPPGICAAWEDGRLLCLQIASSELFSVHVLQLKRTNVGIALVTSPRVLFLDEPTSGGPTCTLTSCGYSCILTMSAFVLVLYPLLYGIYPLLNGGKGSGHNDAWQPLCKHVARLHLAPLSSHLHGLPCLQAWTRSRPLRQVASAYCQQSWSLQLTCC